MKLGLLQSAAVGAAGTENVLSLEPNTTARLTDEYLFHDVLFVCSACVVLGFSIFGMYTFAVAVWSKFSAKRRPLESDQGADFKLAPIHEGSESKEASLSASTFLGSSNVKECHVFVTNHGKHYHKSNCKWIATRSTSRLLESEAVGLHLKKPHLSSA